MKILLLLISLMVCSPLAAQTIDLPRALYAFAIAVDVQPRLLDHDQQEGLMVLQNRLRLLRAEFEKSPMGQDASARMALFEVHMALDVLRVSVAPEERRAAHQRLAKMTMEFSGLIKPVSEKVNITVQPVVEHAPPLPAGRALLVFPEAPMWGFYTVYAIFTLAFLLMFWAALDRYRYHAWQGHGRKNPRFEMQEALQVLSRRSVQTTTSINISKGGLAMQWPTTPPAVGTRLRVVFNGHTSAFPVKVVHAKDGVLRVAFRKLSKSQRTYIDSILPTVVRMREDSSNELLSLETSEVDLPTVTEKALAEKVQFTGPIQQEPAPQRPALA